LEINAEIVAGLFIPAAFDAVLKVSHLFQDLFYFLRAEHIGAVRIFCFFRAGGRILYAHARHAAAHVPWADKQTCRTAMN
jgi:hypothetical protein